MAAQPRKLDGTIARLTARAHGIVTHAELIAARISRHQIQARLDSGLLTPEFRGVYRVGPRTTESRFMAAVKACGRRAVLSGLAAAYLWGLIKRPPSLPEVTAPGDHDIEGIVTRRRKWVQRATHKGVPVTSVAQTLVDIAPRLTDEDLALACHRAGVKHRTTPRQVKAILSRHPNAPGASKLKRIMIGDTKISLSALEREFLRILREAGLPLPITNKHEGSRYVDCRWPEHGLTVELDSYRFHNSRHAFEQDRRREREARARGDDFRRFTWGDVFETPEQTIAELTPALTA